MNSTHTDTLRGATRRCLWRSLAARLITTSGVGLLVAFALALGAAEPGPRVSAVASTHPLVQTEPSPAVRSIQCTGRPVGRRGSDRATATGFQFDVVVDHAGRGTARRRGPLVVSCGDNGRIVVMACTTNQTRRNSSTRYRDQHGVSLDDLLDELDPREASLSDYGIDDVSDLDRLDDLLEELPSQRNLTATSSTSGRRRLGDVDINIGGLVSLRSGDRDLSTSRTSDPWDRDWDMDYIDEHSDRERRPNDAGICRRIGRR